jgi:hypothetical protein
VQSGKFFWMSMQVYIFRYQNEYIVGIIDSVDSVIETNFCIN